MEQVIGIFNEDEMEQKANERLVDEARDQSVQGRAKEQPLDRGVGAGSLASVSDAINRSLAYFFQAADVLPMWWSLRRDAALDSFWKTTNLLAGAMYTMTSKMATIPWHIEPRDMAISRHLKQAARIDQKLQDTVEFGAGWGQFFSKQVQSLLGQDNGRFMEIIDLNPNKRGPIIGEPMSVAHLDPTRCIRKADPDYPVSYVDDNGTQHALHWTRVAFQAQLPSPRIEMLGVGLCAVSRASSYGQHMLDIAQYKEEKLGSRPNRAIMVAKGGLDAESLGEALAVTAGISDNRGLKRFSLMPIIGSPDIPDAGIDLVSLSQLPDNYDEPSATDIAMAAIALAFGMDARELWPGLQSGATRADALLQHIKQRGKGPGHILSETSRMFDQYFLPPHLRFVFDFQDDAQDRQRAEIRRERSLTRKNDISMNVTDYRTERELMLRDGEMTSAQFSNLELEDGRLPDGTPLETVFYRESPIYNEILNFPGIADPLDIRANDPAKMLDIISAQISVALKILSEETRQIPAREARESYEALLNLRDTYEKEAMRAIGMGDTMGELDQNGEVTPEEPASEGHQGVREGPKVNREGDSDANLLPTSEEQQTSAENSPRDFKKEKNVLKKLFGSKDEDPRQLAFEAFKELLAPPPIIVELKPEIHIPETQVIVNVPEQEPAQIVFEQEPPVVNVRVPEKEVNVNIPETVVNVTVPEQKAPVVNVSPPEVNVQVEPPVNIAPVTKESGDDEVEVIDIQRDASGAISGLTRKKKK